MPTLTSSQFFTDLRLVLIFAAIIFIVLVAALYIARMIVRRLHIIPDKFTKLLILVKLPKESAVEENQQPDITETIRQRIGAMENLFSILGGQKVARGLKTWFYGREDELAFEIVAQHGWISFYVSVPKYLFQHVQQQIHAQFPDAELTLAHDYNIFKAYGQVKGFYLTLARKYMFPIKTYEQIEGDPLNAITNAMSKVAPEDGLALQIVARSAHKSWHRAGKQVASEMQQGKQLGQALRTKGSKMGWAREMLSYGGVTATKKQDPYNQPPPIHQLSPMEEELVKGLENKTSKAGMEVTLRVVAAAQDAGMVNQYLQGMVDAFSQFNYYEYGNSFKKSGEKQSKLLTDFIYRDYKPGRKNILNSEELASIYHFPIPEIETPNILWLLARVEPAPVNIPKDGLLLGRNLYRGQETKIHIKDEDRRRHMYVIGSTGTGKSAFMQNLIVQDIANGKGVCVIDPHGSLVEEVLGLIPKNRADDVVFFNPADTQLPIGLNMLEAKNEQEADFATQEMIAIFYKLVTDPAMIGPMFEHNMRNAMLTLMANTERPGTIVDIPRIFTDPQFQKYNLKFVTDPLVRQFWEKEMAKTSDFHKSEMLGYLISKVGRFVENAMVRNIIGQPKSGFNFRQIMDEQKILLVNLSKGSVGEMNSNLLGLIIVSKLQMAALSRADIAESERHDFYLYIDEFQNFITDSIATILSEARKYRLDLTLAHQYVNQLVQGNDTKIRDAVFGNVGTLVTFRVGPDDSELIAKQLAPVVSEYDVMNIERFNAYLRLLIDNQASKAFNLTTYPPQAGNRQMAQAVKELSRRKYGRDKASVTKEILERSKIGADTAPRQGPTLERSL